MSPLSLAPLPITSSSVMTMGSNNDGDQINMNKTLNVQNNSQLQHQVKLHHPHLPLSSTFSLSTDSTSPVKNFMTGVSTMSSSVSAAPTSSPLLPLQVNNMAAATSVLMGVPHLLPPMGNPHAPHHPIAEFLYQLTKMLTDNNREVIEWIGGRIQVHDPHRLADQVLHKYFRHSKYASFQRQLNYFGFRKIAGKGKMSPCSYVNDAATEDLRSLLFIKRKTNGSAARKNANGSSTSTSASNSVDTNTALPEEVACPSETVPSSESIGMKRCTNNDINSSDSMEPSPKRQFLEGGTSNSAPVSNVVLSHPAQLLHSNVTNSQQAENLNLSQNVTSTRVEGQEQAQQLTSSLLNQKSFNEQFHFPSENTLAILTTRSNQNHMINVDMTGTFHGQTGNASTAQQNLGPAEKKSTDIQLNNAYTNLASLVTNTSSMCPATAAMNAAAETIQNNNAFENTPNLTSLLATDNSSDMPPPSSNISASLNNSSLMSNLPSCNSLFPDSLSNSSLFNLAPCASSQQNGGGIGVGSGNSFNRNFSSNGMSNMLSRDSSLVDLAMLPPNPKPTQSDLSQIHLSSIPSSLSTEPTPMLPKKDLNEPGVGGIIG